MSAPEIGRKDLSQTSLPPQKLVVDQIGTCMLVATPNPVAALLYVKKIHGSAVAVVPSHVGHGCALFQMARLIAT